ncbi:hypothetical protein SDC9_117483 [bioreactor metagenome]|uniref:Uncharacterized protein n=1 Tax=bioreactor metagenome TaxID=1076179 RepID=A0A645BZK5_9ZZZZ
MLHRPVLDLQHDFVLHMRLARGETIGQLAADHAADDARFVNLLLGHIEGFDDRAVANDRNLIRNIGDFVELMGDDDRGHTFFLELFEQV